MIRTIAGLVVAVLALASAVSLCALGVLYVGADGFVDHALPAVASLSWQVWQGEPLYRPMESVDHELTAYGPYLYAATALVLAAFGPSIAAAKTVGVLAAAATVAVMTVHGWRLGGWFAAAAACALTAAGVLHGDWTGLWGRPEPLIALLVALAVLAAGFAHKADRPPVLLALVVGGLCGLAMGNKVYAAICFAPTVLWAFRTHWLTAWPIVGLSALAVFAVAFAHPAVDLEAWLAGLRAMTEDRTPLWHGLSKTFRHGVLFHAAPVLLLVFAWRTLGDVTIYLIALLAVCLIMIVPSHSPGAGWYYLAPLVPVTADCAIRTCRRMRRADAATAVFCILIVAASAPMQRRQFDEILHAPPNTALDDVQTIAAANPGKTIAMGLGASQESYPKTWVSPWLTFAGQRAFWAPWSEMESNYVGIRPSPAKVAALGACTHDLWLIPKGERPFAMPSYYPGHTAVSGAFQAAFLDAYALDGTLGTFDIWACRAGSGS